MEREREIIKQMLELANEFNNLSCNNRKCEECKNEKYVIRLQSLLLKQ